MSDTRERKVWMTVYKIEADLIDVSTPADGGPGSRFLHGLVRVRAQGGGDYHSWRLKDGEQCWIGDRVEVTVIEPEPSRPTSTPLTVPPLDKR